MPTVAGGRAVAVHRTVVFVKGRVLQARLDALGQLRGLRHAAGDREAQPPPRGKAFPLPLSQGSAPAWSARKVQGRQGAAGPGVCSLDP